MNSIDAGSPIAQPSAIHTTNEITPNPLRAPEIILQGPWDNKVDIWAFGCLVRRRIPVLYFYPLTVSNLQIFEFTTGRALFECRPFLEYGLDPSTAHLWQMLCFTRELMTREQANSSKLGAQYFDLDVRPESPICSVSCFATIGIDH